MTVFQVQEAEQELIGALFSRNVGIVNLAVSPDDFTIPLHGEIYADMKRLFVERQRFDLTDILARHGKDADYIRLLAQAGIGTADSITHWGETVRELSRKRKHEADLTEAIQKLQSQSSAEVVAELITKLTERLDTKRQRSSSDVLKEIQSDLDLPPVRYPTGLKNLDKSMAGGLYAGFTYGLCGKEKAGKTTFAHSISYNLGQSGFKHLYVALEMGAKQIEQRNQARSLGINSLEFLNPSEAMKARVRSAPETPNVVYLDAPGGTLDEILTEISVARLKHKITGFIIDYWQLVGGANSRETEEKHLRTTAQTFADYARRHGLWCVLLAQMNKDGDLFGGGGLRKACDQLYFLETPDSHPDFRWMRMGASRYTPQVDIGSESEPKFALNKKIGPHFEDIYERTAHQPKEAAA